MCKRRERRRLGGRRVFRTSLATRFLIAGRCCFHAHPNLLHEIQASGLTTLQEIATASMLAAFTLRAVAGGIRRRSPSDPSVCTRRQREASRMNVCDLGQSGRHMLAVSFTAPDPFRKFRADLARASAEMILASPGGHGFTATGAISGRRTDATQ